MVKLNGHSGPTGSQRRASGARGRESSGSFSLAGLQKRQDGNVCKGQPFGEGKEEVEKNGELADNELVSLDNKRRAYK